MVMTGNMTLFVLGYQFVLIALFSCRASYSCWTYFLKNYPVDFLNNRELISNFSDSTEKPYVRPGDRPGTPKAADDLDYRP